MSYRSLVVLVSTLLMAIFAGVALFGARLAERRLADTLAGEAQRLQTAYEVSQGELQQQMMALAGMIAADPQAAALLKSAAAAVDEQGSGGERAALLRQQLYLHLYRAWGYLQRELGVRQMQFVLPGSISFLRFHAPAEHGDRLDELRRMPADVERSRQPRSGFETGRTFAGIRGAAPVFDTQVRPGDAPELLAVVETGIAFDGYIQRLSERTGVGFGVLLEPAAVTAAMWESYRPPAASARADACCYLLAASRDELAEWMAGEALPPYAGIARADLVRHGETTFQLIRFPLRDYAGLAEPARPPVGSVLIWQDVGAAIAATDRYKRDGAINLLVAYLVTQLLVLFLVRALRREWRHQLTEQTARVGDLLHQNEVLLMTAGEGIFGVDRNHVTTFINPAAQKMLGYEPAAVVGRNMHALIHQRTAGGEVCALASCPIARTLDDCQPHVCEDWLVRSNGSVFPVQMTVTPIREGGDCNGAVIVFRDISELKEKEAALTHLARTDTLTGLANRRHFIEQLNAEIQRWQRNSHQAALLMVDLDFFKRVNDTWGHATGDEVLGHFAETLRHSLRRIDLPGRVGGEEFAVLLPDCNAADARAAAERLRQLVESQPAPTAAGPVAITVSIGVTLFQAGDISDDQPLLRADRALYRAKQAGRNRVVCDFC